MGSCSNDGSDDSRVRGGFCFTCTSGHAGGGASDESSRVSCWASSSRNEEIAVGTADSVVDAEDSSEGVHTTEVVGSGEVDRPAC